MRTLFLLVFFFSFASYNGQIDKKSTGDILSIGNANFGGLIYQKLDTSVNNFPQLYFQYNEKRDSTIYLRFGISSGINTKKSGNVRFYNFIPTNVYVGLQKIRSLNTIQINYGIDMFLSMSLRGSQLQASWQADDNGAGITVFTGVSYPFSEKFSIHSELNVGAGIFRSFKNFGNTTAVRFTPKHLFLKPLSIGVNYQL